MRRLLTTLLIATGCWAQSSNVVTLIQGPLTCGARVFSSGVYQGQAQIWCFRLTIPQTTPLTPPRLVQNTIQDVTTGSAMISYVDIASLSMINWVIWNEPGVGYHYDWATSQSTAGGKSGRGIFNFP